jgi:hypothetical protein
LTIDSSEITADVGLENLPSLLCHDLLAQGVRRVMGITTDSETITAFTDSDNG